MKIVAGALLLGLAVRQWRTRPRAGAQVAVPKWLQTIDQFEAAKAVGLGFVLSALNPKNVLLVVGAAAAIAETQVSAGSSWPSAAVRSSATSGRCISLTACPSSAALRTSSRRPAIRS